MSAQPDIIYTKVDEAPELASGSFLPIIQSFAKTAGVNVGTDAHPRWLFRHLTTLIRPGQCTGIVGRNGVGKSTLIKLCLGLIEASEGKATIGKRVKVNYIDQTRMQLDGFLKTATTSRVSPRFLFVSKTLTSSQPSRPSSFNASWISSGLMIPPPRQNPLASNDRTLYSQCM